ncbi:MAG TPA: hypothetical protein VMH28_31705 [Candidatus Acidoferrales bacterium]|nr:hypothetical protein [Candidatus Acidoferrales bacterium]
MHYRRIVCLILGLWFGGGIVMSWFGARSFATVTDVMNQSNPGFALQTKPLGPAATRTVLRHEVAEMNRWLFQFWESLQLLIGVFFFCYLLFGTMEGKLTLFVALLMLVLAAIQRIAVSPALGGLGASLDYLPAASVAPERAKFWMLHSAYIGMELAKLGLGVIVCALVLRRPRVVDPLNQLDLVDQKHHRHTNW